MALAKTIENNELWLRCPFCGDSQKNLKKAHFSVNLMTGVYHCFRCNTSGRYSSKEVFSLAGDLDLDLSEMPFEEKEGLPQLIPGAGSLRFSALPRFHYQKWNEKKERWDTWDAFEFKNPKGTKKIGVLSRLGKKSRIDGKRGYAWSNQTSLLSDPDHPLRFVEGPYDVLEQGDIMVGGTLSPFKIAQDFRSHFIILTPDGDIWESSNLRRVFLYGLKRILEQLSVTVVGVEFIPDGKDPDSCPIRDRLLVKGGDLYDLVERIHSHKNSRNPFLLRPKRQLLRKV